MGSRASSRASSRPGGAPRTGAARLQVPGGIKPSRSAGQIKPSANSQLNDALRQSLGSNPSMASSEAPQQARSFVAPLPVFNLLKKGKIRVPKDPDPQPTKKKAKSGTAPSSPMPQ